MGVNERRHTVVLFCCYSLNKDLNGPDRVRVVSLLEKVFQVFENSNREIRTIVALLWACSTIANKYPGI